MWMLVRERGAAQSDALARADGAAAAGWALVGAQMAKVCRGESERQTMREKDAAGGRTLSGKSGRHTDRGIGERGARMGQPPMAGRRRHVCEAKRHAGRRSDARQRANDWWMLIEEQQTWKAWEAA